MRSTCPEQVHLGEPPLHWEFLDIKVKVSLIYLVIYLFYLSRSRWFSAETGDAELICADGDAEAPNQTKVSNLRFQLVLIHEASSYAGRIPGAEVLVNLLMSFGIISDILKIWVTRLWFDHGYLSPSSAVVSTVPLCRLEIHVCGQH